MSHAVNIQSMLEQVIVLEHLALGSKEFYKSNGVTSFEETGYLEPLSTRTLLKGLICEKLIDVAIKGRILLEHVSENDHVALNRLHAQAIVALNITVEAPAGEKLTLRDSFNKIIHATYVSIAVTESVGDPDNTHFWDGIVHLAGRQNKNEWSHRILVSDWAKAVRRLILQLLREEQLTMLGWDMGLG